MNSYVFSLPVSTGEFSIALRKLSSKFVGSSRKEAFLRTTQLSSSSLFTWVTKLKSQEQNQKSTHQVVELEKQKIAAKRKTGVTAKKGTTTWPKTQLRLW